MDFSKHNGKPFDRLGLKLVYLDGKSNDDSEMTNKIVNSWHMSKETVKRKIHTTAL